MWYDGAIMMVRTQITLDSEIQKRARRRASELGVSLAEYVRQVITRDLAEPQIKSDVSSIFNLGSSGGSNIARNKEAMVAEAFDHARKRLRKSA
jgi:GH24 family phage-related lysozyme (muramidase)